MTANPNPITQADPSKTRLRLWLRLLRTTRALESELREKLRKDHNSTLPRFDVMAALYQYPNGLKMSELSGVLRVSNGNVTGIVDRLVKDGMILRSPVPGDRRALMVCLTQRGKEEFSKQATEHENWIDNLLSTISLNDAEDMIKALDQVSTQKTTKGNTA